MQEKIIKKMSLDKKKFITVEGVLNLTTKVLDCKINFSSFKKMFEFDAHELFLYPEKIANKRTIYLYDKDDIPFTCFNCFIGFRNLVDPLNIYTGPIDFIFENKLSETNNVYIKHMTLLTSLPKKFGMYIGALDFKYTNSKKVSVKKSYEGNNLILDYTITSLKAVKYNQLSNIAYAMLELTFLLMGDVPKIEKIKIHDKNEYFLYLDNAPKYIQRKKISSTNGILAYFESKNITSDLVKNFIKFRKNTKILFDMLLIHMNGDNYLEITNSMLVQLLEGLYKTTNPGVKKKLWEILEFYYLQNPITNTLLSNRDLKKAGDIHNTPIFLLKAKEHRHYLSHLNMNEAKKVFFELENNYAYWKLCLCIRIYIMQNIGIIINQDELTDMEKSIERWAKEHRLRYKK